MPKGGQRSWLAGSLSVKIAIARSFETSPQAFGLWLWRLLLMDTMRHATLSRTRHLPTFPHCFNEGLHVLLLSLHPAGFLFLLREGVLLQRPP